MGYSPSSESDSLPSEEGGDDVITRFPTRLFPLFARTAGGGPNVAPVADVVGCGGGGGTAVASFDRDCLTRCDSLVLFTLGGPKRATACSLSSLVIGEQSRVTRDGSAAVTAHR